MILKWSTNVKCKQVLIAIDQFFNALFGGMADETLSARAWRLRNTHKRWRLSKEAIDRLFFFQPNHCYHAYMNEIERKQLPKDYRP
nr:DNA helicase UvrD [Spirabiliibacterium mucosae]